MKQRFMLILVFPFLLTACGGNSSSKNTQPSSAAVQSSSVTTSQAASSIKSQNSSSIMLQSSVATMSQGSFANTSAAINGSMIEGVKTFPDRNEYHKHVSVVAEPEATNPPVFGEHFPTWQNCGAYDKPINLGNALHSMEHGAVWLTYRPNLDPADIKGLQDLIHGHGYVLMSPYSKQTVDVVMTAWGVQLVVESLPDIRIQKFIEYFELGPQNPEPGAPCSGSNGTPLK
jgi:hypothetical protein